MTAGWETTSEDIINVCCNNNIHTVSEEKAEEILDQLATDKIEREALRGDDMDEQIDYAYLEIWEQIINNNLLEGL